MPSNQIKRAKTGLVLRKWRDDGDLRNDIKQMLVEYQQLSQQVQLMMGLPWGDFTTGSFTVPNETFRIAVDHITLRPGDNITLVGTGILEML